ncbi:hypothetical protein ACFYKX_08150 [Cytobacillus sp. FJAT-54145]|uniref:Uncharacterized protein n=1 Tax=Cytobacillus spartinae TaxID=3299023 RepID=A0ABW6KBH5_9BACI
MKTFRISWFAVVEDDSVLEGRSLIRADDEEKALEELFAQKLHEYRLKPNMLNIQSVIEIEL